MNHKELYDPPLLKEMQVVNVIVLDILSFLSCLTRRFVIIKENVEIGYFRNMLSDALFL